jgi:hypothetical protein
MEMYFEHEIVGGEQQFIFKKVDNITDNGFCMTICFLNEECHFSFLVNSACCMGSFDMAPIFNFTLTQTIIGNFKKGIELLLVILFFLLPIFS